MSNNNIRIKTNPDGTNKNVNLSINQKFDFIEILSLKISQRDVYRRFSSDYGVVIGRVIINNGFGVPNAKVSIFIPIDDDDKLDPEILGLYPFEVVTDRDSDGIPYNLMSKSPNGKDECHTTIGTFPNKREIQDNPEINKIYRKYYKFTTTTNESGDYMLFGVPIGTHFLHVDADISDIGIISQRPYDLISQGVDKNKFYSASKFKNREQDTNITQLKSVSPTSVNVAPFWGDIDGGEIGITRTDVDLKTTIIPSAIFMGSVITDDEKDSVNKNCRPRKKLGRGDELVTGEGTIEMIRYNTDGSISRFDVEGGRVIDENGAWAYQIPMNLDHKITAEDGTLIPSDDPTKGLPTRARVRFKVDMDNTGDDGRLRTRAKYLVPHNPDSDDDSDYSFNSTTRDKYFKDLFWNKIYTVTNHITRTQPNNNVENRNFVGMKDVDEGGQHNPIPFNKMDTKTNPLFIIICIIVTIIIAVVCLINRYIIIIINFIFSILNAILKFICKAVFAVAKFIASVGGIFLSSSKKKKLRRRGCIGCCENDSCTSCDCNAIIDLLGYITIGCEGEQYAPCGRAGDEGPGNCGGNNGNWVAGLTWLRTQRRLSYESQTEPTEEEPGNLCNPPIADDEIVDFHYENDCDCHEKTLLGGLFEIDDAGVLDCILLTIAEQLNVFKFDFYNDWLNGTLYHFLLKYKRKKDGDDKFCNHDLDWSNDIVDSCIEAKPQDQSADYTWSGIGAGNGVDSSDYVGIRQGYIKRTESGELFYSAHATGGRPYRLFATDIVSLGSVFDCDWQGIPKIYPWLIETTYNIPPLIAEYNPIPSSDGTHVVEVSGFDTGFCNKDITPLIGHINCLGLQTGAKQCNNINRLSEFGMGLDENRTGGFETSDANNAITNTDVENPFVRGAFIYANKKDEFNLDTIPLTYIDGPLTTDIWQYNDENYRLFRNPTIGQIIWQFDNSFYFYFGLNAGKTALNKLITNFFPPCVPETENDFYVIATDIIEDDLGSSPTGKIFIDVVGGIGPFTYMWVGPVVNGIQYPVVNNTKDIIELFVGTYIVTVTDSIGNVAEGTFIVPGPPSVNCETQATPITSNGANDGEILVNIFSGIAPFEIQLWNNTTNTLISTNNTSNNNWLYTGLAALEYRVVVTDSGNPATSCESIITVTQPAALNVFVDGTSVTCFGSTNGTAFATVSGGQPPYNVLWSPGGETILSLNNLSGGEYTANITDSIGQQGSDSYVVTSPSQINYNVTGLRNITCLGDNDGRIVINGISGGNPPYTIRLEGGVDDIDVIFNGTSHTFDNLTYGDENNSNTYVYTIEDEIGCQITDTINIYKPDEAVGGVIFYNGSTIVASPTGGFSDTLDEDDNIIGSYSYIWKKDGVTQTGETNQTVNSPSPGLWLCIIRDSNGTGQFCTHTTNTQTVT